MRTKLAKEVEDFLNEHTKITSGDNEYFFVPFWYKKNEDGTFEKLSRDNLPKDLVKVVTDTQNTSQIDDKQKAYFRISSPIYDKNGFSVGPEPDNRLVIFFHVAIMQNWKRSFDIIMKHVHKSEIYRKANIHVIVCGDWGEFEAHAEDRFFFFSNTVRFSENTVQYEFPTLNRMKAITENGYSKKLLYIHTKGASHDNVRFEDNLWWLEKLCIDTFYQSELAMNLLDTHDAVGPLFANRPFDHFCGNFFYTTSFHVNRLKELEMNPLGNFDWKLALSEKFGLRHDAEKWICSIPGRYKTLS